MIYTDTLPDESIERLNNPVEYVLFYLRLLQILVHKPQENTDGQRGRVEGRYKKPSTL